MIEISAMDILARSLQKYGELAVTEGNIPGLLQKHSITENARISGVTFGHLKEAIAANGDILEENIDEQSFVAVIRTGSLNATCALVVAILQKDELCFAGYAKEGLIKQHLVQRAIDSIKKLLR